MRRFVSLFRFIFGLLCLLAIAWTACDKEPKEENPQFYGTWVDTLDGTVYRTLQIGDQLWMADNINRGEMIDGEEDQADNGVIEKYCYDNNPVLCDNYGGLYQWDEAMQYTTKQSAQGICPESWHIPSDSEWKIMELFIGMSQEDVDNDLWRGADQGLMLQSGGDTGFEALRGGNRFVTGSFSQIGNTGYFWTSTGAEDYHAWRRGISISDDRIYRSVNHKSFGFSIRCVKY